MTITRIAQFAAATVIVLLSASAASAQNHFPMPGAPIADAPLRAATVQFATESKLFTTESKRPGLLLPLYVSAGVLQAMDLYTTSRGMNAGAHETNPLVRNGNAGTTLALKAATTGVGIVIAEKLWKKNKGAAIAAMVATNVVTGAIVANNYRVISAQKTR